MALTRKRVAVTAVAATLALAGCGGDDDAATLTGSAPGNPTDRAFVTEAVPLQENAVAIARVAQTRARTPYLVRLAADTIAARTREIATMRHVDTALRSAGVALGTLGVAPTPRASATALGSAEPFEPAFLRAMIALHEGVIARARVEVARGRQPQLVNVAKRILRGEQAELRAMRERLASAR